VSKHLKRLAVPRRWTVPRKAHKWATKPRAGPHAGEESVPMAIVLRDYLHLCDTSREAQRILGAREVLVDGRVVTDYKRGVGLMDVLSIPKVDRHYRALVDTAGRLRLVDIPKAQADWKLCRVEGKTTVKEGQFQLNLHDGRNLQIKENKYATGDVLKLKLPEQKVAGHHALAEGMLAYITGGSHVGELATITKIVVTHEPRANLVELRAGDRAFATVKPYVFVVGKDEPEIRMPEVAIQ